MCFFTHTNAIALFPYCSYVHKETLEITGNLDIQPHYCLNGSIHRKWFDSVDAIDASHRRSEFASHRIRFVGDDNCFIVALEAPPSVALIPDFVFITSWEMDYTMRDPSLKFEVIRGPSRRYYCIAQAEMFRWVSFYGISLPALANAYVGSSQSQLCHENRCNTECYASQCKMAKSIQSVTDSSGGVIDTHFPPP